MSNDKIRTKVVGTTFLPNKEVLNKVEDQDFVVILPQFDNEHDPTACAVVHVHTGERIGYLKRENDFGPFSKNIWEEIAKTKEAAYFGRVTEVTGGKDGKDNLGFNITISKIIRVK